ncbi:hypothetical protein ACQUW5_02785 [Legionella sp. CNM-1927-20]|uniref:hypothetical protein n=1 Tax=Legionella sp. CNM-1927-20 TaxID=3422221 RepID=UPI00403B1ABB
MYSKYITENSKIDTFFQLDKANPINQQSPSRTINELQTMQGLLNSQRIKLIFGNYEVELVAQEDNVRVSNLHSDGIMRTCAIVNFVLPIPVWLQNTHSKIYGGGSIGQTIKDNGFDLTKENIYFGITKLPKTVQAKMETDEDLTAVHIYQLLVKNPLTSESIVYCTISELHSPLYLTCGDLYQLNPGSQKYSTKTNLVQKCLKDLSVLDEYFTHSNNNKP